MFAFLSYLDQVLRMNYSDILQKSDVGREEIKYQSLGVLPREARTLLIMIDGKRTFQNYLDSLDQSKMFADFGGITPLLELLFELDFIEVVGQNNLDPTTVVTAPANVAAEAAPKNNDVEFDRTFSTQFNEDIVSSTTALNSQTKEASFEKNKSDLATYIEKNAQPDEAWGYLLTLEQSEDNSQLLALAQNIQNTSNTALSRGISDIIKKLKR